MSGRAGLRKRGTREVSERETAEQTLRRLGSETAEQTSLRLGLETVKQGRRRRRRLSLATAVSAVVLAFALAAHGLAEVLGVGSGWAVVLGVAIVAAMAMKFRRWLNRQLGDGVL